MRLPSLPLPARGLRRWAAMTLYFLLGVVVIGVGTGYATRYAIADRILGQAGYDVRTKEGGGYEVVVPADKIPQSVSEREDAPSVALLPNHWEGQEKESQPGAPDTASVPAASRQELAEVSLAFLKVWETFPAAASSAEHQQWRTRVARFASSGSEDRIVSREESFAPVAICPKPPCIIGSSWYGPYPPDRPITVRSYDGVNAYVTLYGLVRYRDARGRGLEGKVALREYALLFERFSGQWRLTRAVASTIR